MKLSELLRILQDAYDAEGDMDVSITCSYTSKKGNRKILDSEPNVIYVEPNEMTVDELTISDSKMEDILYFDKDGNPVRMSGKKRRYYM